MTNRVDIVKKYYNPRITEICRLSVDCISLKLEDTLQRFSMWIDCTFENNTISFDWNKVVFTQSENDMIERVMQPIMFERAKQLAKEYLTQNQIFVNR